MHERKVADDMKRLECELCPATIRTDELVELTVDVIVNPVPADARRGDSRSRRVQSVAVPANRRRPPYPRIAPNATDHVELSPDGDSPAGLYDADVRWDPPHEMTQGESDAVTATLLVPTFGMSTARVESLLREAMVRARAVRSGRVSVGSSAIANIEPNIPAAFSIRRHAEYEEEQPVVPGLVTTWTWHILPLKPGRYTLTLSVYSPLKGDVRFASRTKIQEVGVDGRLLFEAKQFARDYDEITGAIIAVVLTAVATVVGFLYRSRRRRYRIHK
jgi:hypothetical protein